MTIKSKKLITEIKNKDGISPVQVYCTLDGWTRVINRINYEGVSFNQPFAKYKSGFGTLTGNYWLGLENIRNLIASKTYHVRIELESSFIEYDSFYIDTESNGYQLKVGSKIKGDLYDSFPRFHNGLKFSTYDKIQGGISRCPTDFHSGWWYNTCYNANLLSFNSGLGQWFDGSSYSKFYQNAKMFLRPSSFQLGEKE
jgi:ficolin